VIRRFASDAFAIASCIAAAVYFGAQLALWMSR